MNGAKGVKGVKGSEGGEGSKGGQRGVKWDEGGEGSEGERTSHLMKLSLPNFLDGKCHKHQNHVNGSIVKE